VFAGLLADCRLVKFLHFSSDEWPRVFDLLLRFMLERPPLEEMLLGDASQDDDEAGSPSQDQDPPRES
jgi:hypothetical protein